MCYVRFLYLQWCFQFPRGNSEPVVNNECFFFILKITGLPCLWGNISVSRSENMRVWFTSIGLINWLVNCSSNNSNNALGLRCIINGKIWMMIGNYNRNCVLILQVITLCFCPIRQLLSRESHVLLLSY